MTTDEAIRDINKYMSYEEDWDSYGAKTITESARQLAIHFVTNYPEYLSYVAPCANGGIVVVWERLSSELEIWCMPDGTFDILVVLHIENEKTQYVEEDDISFAHFDELYRKYIALVEV